MLHREYTTQTCNIARALEVVGERWSLLIVRELWFGTSTFDDLVRRLGITRGVLSARLERLVDEGVVDRTPYQDRPVRHAYHLTEAGRDLWPVLMHLARWGGRYHPSPQGAPDEVVHADCGGRLDEHLNCDRCTTPLNQANTVRRARADTATPRG